MKKYKLALKYLFNKKIVNMIEVFFFLNNYFELSDKRFNQNLRLKKKIELLRQEFQEKMTIKNLSFQY